MTRRLAETATSLQQGLEHALGTIDELRAEGALLRKALTAIRNLPTTSTTSCYEIALAALDQQEDR